MEYKIFCDINGVLTDFTSTKKNFKLLTGYEPYDFEKRFGFQKFKTIVIEEIGIKNWLEPNWVNDSYKIWNQIKDHNVTFLAAPSKGLSSMYGKTEWIKNNLMKNPDVIFEFPKNKIKHVSINSVLIDDKPNVIREWEKSGGIGILCENGNIDNVLKKIQSYE